MRTIATRYMTLETIAPLSNDPMVARITRSVGEDSGYARIVALATAQLLPIPLALDGSRRQIFGL